MADFSAFFAQHGVTLPSPAPSPPPPPMPPQPFVHPSRMAQAPVLAQPYVPQPVAQPLPSYPYAPQPMAYPYAPYYQGSVPTPSQTPPPPPPPPSAPTVVPPPVSNTPEPSSALVVPGSSADASGGAAVEEPIEYEAVAVVSLEVDGEASEIFPVRLSITALLKEKKKAKRRRWGQTSEEVLTGTGTADAENKRRRKRWGSEQDKVNIPTNPLIAAAAANLKPDEARALILRLRIDDLTKKIGNPMQAMADIPEHERSPSPEPVYDAQGKRLNTRPYRLREKLISQRHDCIIEAQKLIPDFRPPADYKPPKIHAKIFIPVDKYPDFGFMGLIIGPRGATHKKMERETNTKIAIRGKGTAKDNKLGRPQPGEDEPMHVYVQGERQDDVDRAARMIRELLRPDDAKIEEHKQEQLKQLALLNGTWREEIRCRVCNEPGHRIFDCPQRSGSWVAANVVCEICGESTHITKDCRKLLNKDFAVEKQKMITEYDAFMAELTSDRGSVGGASGPTLALTGPDGTALPAADGNRAVPAPLSSGAPAAAPPPYLAGTAIPPYLRNQQRMQQQQQQQQQVQQYQQLQQQQMQQQWGYGAPAWGAYAAPTPPPHYPSAAPPMPPQWPPYAYGAAAGAPPPPPPPPPPPQQ